MISKGSDYLIGNFFITHIWNDKVFIFKEYSDNFYIFTDKENEVIIHQNLATYATMSLFDFSCYRKNDETELYLIGHDKFYEVTLDED